MTSKAMRIEMMVIMKPNMLVRGADSATLVWTLNNKDSEAFQPQLSVCVSPSPLPSFPTPFFLVVALALLRYILGRR